MQAGAIAFARGRSGRHLRYVALGAALAVVDGWLWLRLLLRTTGEHPITPGEIGLAAAAGLAALLAIAFLWRSPMTSNMVTMSTPSLLHALATHRAGHLVAEYTMDRDRVTAARATDPCRVRRRARSAVVTSTLRSELVIAYSGMTAEEILSGETGSYSASDLAGATAIAVDMVGRFGMSGSVVSFGPATRNRKQLARRVLEDPRARKELEGLLRDAKREAARLILENRHEIIALRDALLQQRRIDRARIRELVRNAKAAPHTDDPVLVDLRSVAKKPLVDAI